MKKISSIFVTVVLVAFSAVSVFAAGINVNEKTIIDALNTPIAMAKGNMKIPSEFINQAENYFNTIEITEEESKAIIANLEEMGRFMTGTGAENITDMTYAQKQELLAHGRKVVGVIGLTMEYNMAERLLIIYDPNNNIIFSDCPVLEPINSGSSSNTSNNTDNGVIKATGAQADFSGFAAVGAVAVIFVVAGAVYFVKTKKEV